MSEAGYEFTNAIDANIKMIASTLRNRDRIMVWNTGYQVHIDGMGTSNFIINNDLEEKAKIIEKKP